MTYGPFCHHQIQLGKSSEKAGPCPFKNTRVHACPAPRDSTLEVAARQGAGGAGFVNGATEGEGRRGRGGGGGSQIWACSLGSRRKPVFSCLFLSHIHSTIPAA